ncbi:hypothetical protein [Nitrosopumilus sp.]|uniref:hypothetical protein n=1 Tax=Nitrosopumilus sp. TaxID=2024843 RepID=UPI0034A02696
MSKKRRKSLDGMCRTVIQGDKKKKIEGLINRKIVRIGAISKPSKLDSKFRLTLFGVFYAMHIFSVFEDRDNDKLQKSAIIKHIKKNYKDYLPLIFENWDDLEKILGSVDDENRSGEIDALELLANGDLYGTILEEGDMLVNTDFLYSSKKHVEATVYKSPQDKFVTESLDELYQNGFVTKDELYRDEISYWYYTIQFRLLSNNERLQKRIFSKTNSIGKQYDEWIKNKRKFQTKVNRELNETIKQIS